MENTARIYRIGGHRVRVVMDAPWLFKPLTPDQAALVARLARGEDIGVIPVPADKQQDLSVNEQRMGKEAAMTRERWETLSAEERDIFRHAIDFQQYAPFEDAEEGPVLFTLRVSAESPEWIEKDRAEWTRVVAVDEMLPYYYGYRYGEWTVYEYFPAEGISAGLFVLNGDFSEGTYYPRPRIGAKTTLMQVNTSLMIQFTFATAPLDTLLLHASVIREAGRANLFFGVSGTGKSTHSRLWLSHVPGCDLMNDDNPVIRFEDGKLMVYGSPWSGKTLCYRNVVAPVRALVRLEQAPENRIERLLALDAYASVIAAASTIRWNPSVMDRLIPTVERIAMNVPCFRLGCRPDAEAVETCRAGIGSDVLQ